MAYFNGKQILFSPNIHISANEPEGTIEITENGTHDVKDYAEAVVNVEGGGGGDAWDSFCLRIMTEAIFPVGTIYIPMYSFEYMESLKSIVLSNTVESIGERAFASCGLSGTLNIPASVMDIQSETFGSNADLTEVIFEGTPNNIDSWAFYDSGVQIIKCSFGEGEVDGAPWGAEEADIIYDWEG